jgi:hopanoid biosynthesis associated RND transporter like protein HpnN
MTSTWHQLLTRFLSTWIGFVERYRLSVSLLIILGAALSLHYTANNLGMNTNTQDMLSPELDWRQLDAEMDKSFPQYVDSILIVIEAQTPDEAGDAGKLLYRHLSKETDLFKSVYYPSGLDFFRNSALLFLDTDELQDLADNLAAIQPFLSRLTEDQSIRGLFNMLTEAVDARMDGDEIDLTSLNTRLDESLAAVENGRHYRLSWQALMGGTDENKPVYREYIVIQPILDYGGLLPATQALDRIRSLVNEFRLTRDNHLEIRLTGGAALSHEELQSVFSGTGVSLAVALILVAVILIAGLRSGWMVLAALITLITGLVYTAGFAALAIGKLNLISVAFAILYIGLGVDFAVHFCLRYREYREKGSTSALRDTAEHIGDSLILCAATTAIGFYAFVPTDYDGVAELGLISGTGMFISLIITLTFLPALLSLFPVSFRIPPAKSAIKNFTDPLMQLPVSHAGKVRITVFILAAISLLTLPALKFDHNTLNLQSPGNESVQTYLDLLADSDSSPWKGLVLARSAEEAEKISARLSGLPVVDKVVWIQDFIPSDQETKLDIIGEMDLLLGPFGLDTQLPAPSDEDRIASMQSFHQTLSALIEKGLAGTEDQILHKTLGRFLGKLDTMSVDDRHKLLVQLEKSLLATFPGRLEALQQSMNADFISAETLPEELKSRWQHNGRYRVEIHPADNLMDNSARRKFVDEVRAVVPQLIGSPVVTLEAGDAVVAAFQQAFFYALFAIIALLLVLTERKKDVVFIITPLLLAAIFTAATAVLLDIHLNFANIIALPLLLGIGVDSAIHILHRHRTSSPAEGPLLATSSARAVVVSALTTILSIGNLAFSSHLGTASMGQLLTIGISMTLICSLVVLPSLLAGYYDRTRNNQNKTDR